MPAFLFFGRFNPVVCGLPDFLFYKEIVMTVSSSYAVKTYVGNGQTKSFAVPYKFMNDEIEVYKNKSRMMYTKGVDYVVIGNGESGTGSIEFVTAPPEGEYVTIVRSTALNQLVKFMNGEDFPAEDFEYALDRIIMALQETVEKVGRCIEFPVGEDSYQEWYDKLIKYKRSDEGHIFWSATTTYAKNEIVTDGIQDWISNCDNNIGHNPSAASNSAYWIPFAARYRNGIVQEVSGIEDIEKPTNLFLLPVMAWQGYAATNHLYQHFKVVSPFADAPTIDLETKKAKFPAGIDGYFTAAEVEEKIAQNGALYKGVWDKNTQYYKGDIVCDCNNRFVIAIHDNIGSDPNNSNNLHLWNNISTDTLQVNYWANQNSEYPLVIYNGGTVGNFYKAAEDKAPTFNGETGQLTIPGGIKGYYTKTEIDGMIKPRIEVHNIEVSAEGWEADTVIEGYSYRKDIAVEGCSESHFPHVVFDIAEINSGNFSPLAASQNGYVSIWAKEVPAAAFTILNILLN